MNTQASAEDQNSWRKVLLFGAGLYVLVVVTLVLTGNPNLFPTVVLVGNFLIPVVYVVFFYERDAITKLPLSATALSFVYGGILGVVAASILTPIFISGFNLLTVFVIGLIEEFAKIIGVLVVARSRRHEAEIHGLVMGAAAGMGFAALESTGYAFNAFLQSQGSLSATVIVTLVRGVLAPLGHGTWTAILGSVLFRESEPGDYHINLKVIGAYLGVVLLHALWNGLPAVLSAVVPSGVDAPIGQLIVGAIGLFVLWRLWRQGVKRQEASEPASA
ncbi:MAG: PrsW family intramembrane metalloprotease [Anaerolineae bacterium]